MAAPSEKHVEIQFHGKDAVFGTDSDQFLPKSLDQVLLNKIKRICHLVVENRLPGDDTFLEKLLTMVNSYVHRHNGHNEVNTNHNTSKQHDTGRTTLFSETAKTKTTLSFDDTLLKALDIEGLLQSAKASSDLQPEAMSFVLRIMGCMADLCICNLEASLLASIFHKATDELWWHEPSVRCAWLEALQKFLQAPGGWTLLRKIDYSRKVEDCLTDKSLFVSKMATSLYFKILTRKLTTESVESMEGEPNLLDGPNMEYIMQPVLELCTPSAAQDVSREASVITCLGILEQLCTNSTALKHLTDRYHLVKIVANILTEDCNRQTCQSAIRLLGALEKGCVVSKEDFCKLQDLTLELFIANKVNTALDVANWLMTCTSTSVDSNRMLQVIQLPVYLQDPDSLSFCDNETYRSLEPSIRDALQSSSANKGKNLLQSFSMLGQISQLMSLSDKETALVLCERFLQQSRQESGDHQRAKLLQSCLDTCARLLQVKESAKSQEFGKIAIYRDLLSNCVYFVHCSLSSYMIIHKSLKLLVPTLQVLIATMPDLDQTLKDTLAQLAESAKRRLCDLKWEVKDSMLECMGHLARLCAEPSWLQAWFLEQQLVRQIWLCVQDGESYVRASALTALEAVSSSSRVTVWQQLLDLVSEADIFNGVHKVVTEDTEAFARRAAARVLLSWHQTDLMPTRSQDILEVMKHAMHDLDWEVKLTVLNFWQSVVMQTLESSKEDKDAIPAYAASLVSSPPKKQVPSAPDLIEGLNFLNQCGCADLLLAATTDCDRVVQRKALEILQDIQTRTVANALNSNSDAQISSTDSQTETFPSKLSALDFETLLREADQSTDQYTCNPETLLDDILASMVHSQDNGERGDDGSDVFAVDCY